jgi:hypothetical protein
MDYENTICFITPSQDFHPLGLFKDTNLKVLNFLTWFYRQPQQKIQWELLHKSRDFSTNILNLFLKAAKVCIQKIISYGWVQIGKGKLCGKTLKAYQVRNKQNLNSIFKIILSLLWFRRFT